MPGIEEIFDAFVRESGGEIVRDLLPRGIDLPKNADYLLFGRAVVAELKCLEKNYFNSRRIGAKIATIANTWIREGLIRPDQFVDGRFSTNNLPPRCALQVLKVFGTPIKKAVVDANRQIRQTKMRFGLPKAKGLLILANDGNFSLTPDLSMQILGRLFRDHFSSVESFIYFAPALGVRVPDIQKDTRVWISGQCRKIEGVPPDLLRKMHLGWISFLRKRLNEPIELIEVGDHSFLADVVFLGKRSI